MYTGPPVSGSASVATGPPSISSARRALSPSVIDLHGAPSVRVRLGRHRVPKHLVSPPRYLLIKLGKLLIVPDGDSMGGKLQRLAGKVIPLRDVTPRPVNDRLQLGNHGPLEGVRGRPAVGVQGPLEPRPQRALEGARDGYSDPVFAILEFEITGVGMLRSGHGYPFAYPEMRHMPMIY